jgi:serine/threonine-protein kinase
VKRLPGSGREVFLGADATGREVVLEVLSAPQRNQGLLDSKIADEATSYARLSHPNLVKVVDLFSADGRFVIAVEHLDGTTLEVLRDALAGMPLDQADACWLYVVACLFDGLAAAHGATASTGEPNAVLHRNVNPSNVQVAWDGTVKLGNFNVANVSTVLRESNPGFTWASFGYLAPEQAKLEKAGPRSDVYSTMLVLWELLAGRRAIERGTLSDMELLERVASLRLPPLEETRPTIHPRVLEALHLGLQPDPARRIIDAAHARDVLRSAIDVEAARRRFAEAVAHARSSHDAPTVSPPPSDEKLLVPSAAQLAAPSVPKIPPVPTAPSLPHTPPPLPIAGAPLVAAPPPTQTVEELDVCELESVRPPPAPAPVIVSEPPPASLQRRKGVAQIAVVASLGLGACILIAAGVAWSRTHREGAELQTQEKAVERAATATVTASATAATTERAPAAPTESPTTTATATPSPATAAEIPSDVGELQPPPSAAGHRIYVDGRVVGEGTAPLRVKCAQHSVRIGSAGRTQYVDVPCGQAIALQR